MQKWAVPPLVIVKIDTICTRSQVSIDHLYLTTSQVTEKRSIALQWLFWRQKNLLCETGRHYLSAQLFSTIFVISIWLVLHIDVSPPKRARNTALTSVVGAEKLTMRDGSSQAATTPRTGFSGAAAVWDNQLTKSSYITLHTPLSMYLLSISFAHDLSIS